MKHLLDCQPPIYYILQPDTGPWAGHYNPVMEWEYFGENPIRSLGMYSCPEGANYAINRNQQIYREQITQARQQHKRYTQ